MKEGNHSKQEKPNVQSFQFGKILESSRCDRTLGWLGGSQRERESTCSGVALDIGIDIQFCSESKVNPLEHFKQSHVII